MKTKRTMTGMATVLGGLLLLVSLPAPLYAQVDAMTQARITATFGLMSPRLLNALNLTPEQAAKIEASKNAFRDAQRAYLSEIRVLRQEVGDKLFGANRAAEADVARAITKIADLREKILREGFRIALDVRNVLTPEQLAKAATIRQHMIELQSEVRELYNENQ
ncbi:MAG: Spy/CpxP family protein refolding chaperone [Candidatus Binatia bacterium]